MRLERDKKISKIEAQKMIIEAQVIEALAEIISNQKVLPVKNTTKQMYQSIFAE
jgi:hypothetical protein